MTSLFPRGGSITNTNTNTHQSSAFPSKKRNLEDNLFGNQSSRTKRIEVISNKKKRKDDTNTGSSLSTISNIGLGMTKTAANNKMIKIDHISFAKLNTGCLVIGYILQINNDCLIISLPGSSTGIVAHHEVSDVFHKMKMTQMNDTRKVKLPDLSSIVSPLQMVRCYVLDQVPHSEGSQKKIIRLSMRASLINRGLTMKNINAGMAIYGCIASKEDHGYIVAGGINGCNFFLPSKAIPTSKGELVIGQPIECVCTGSNEVAQTATLRAHPKAVYEALTMSGSLAFTSLIPGMLVKVVIDKIVENGVIVNFLGMFHGAIDIASLPSPTVGSEWSTAMKEGNTCNARIILVDHATKSIRLSLCSHVLEMRAPRFLPALGEVLENLTVANASKSTGVLCIYQFKDNGSNDIIDPPSTANVSEAEDIKGIDTTGKKRKSNLDALALKQKRDEDEYKVPVFINKSVLAASLDPNQDESSEVIDIERIIKVYKSGSMIPSVRVKGYNLVEGLVVASNISSYVEGSVVHVSDVKVGQLLAVEVIAIKDFGLVVQILGGRVTAVCPTLHSADVVLEGSGSKLKKKFKVGQELNVRVWEVSSSGIIVTNKKSMVDLDEEEDASVVGKDESSGLLTSFTCKQSAIGNIVIGVISSVSSKGIDVRFFNKVRGMVPMVVLAKQGVLDPLEAYRPGEILKTIIIGKVVAENEKSMLYLALNISKDKQALLKLMETIELPPGVVAITTNDALSSNNLKKQSKKSSQETTVSMIEEKDNLSFPSQDRTSSSIEQLFVSGDVYKIEDDYALVRLENGKTGKIQKYHFFDLASTSDVLFNHIHGEIKVGMHIKDALILYQQKGMYVLTLKPLLIEAIKSSTSSTADSDVLRIPSKVADLSPGQIIAGYIVKVDTYGVIVRFQGNMSALAPRPNIADKFISTPVGIFTLGDSMRCAVQRVDLSTDKAIVTFKSSVVSHSSGNISYLHTLLKERYLKSKTLTIATKKVFPNWKQYLIGSVVKVTVTAIEDYGVVLLADDNITMLFARHVSADRLDELVVDATVKALVLDIDFENGVLLVSIETTLTKINATVPSAAEGNKSKKKKTASANIDNLTAISIGEKHDAKVLLVEKGYLVVYLLKMKLLGYVMLADYHNPSPNIDRYEVDQVILVKAISVATNTGGFLNDNSVAAVIEYPHQKQTIFTLFEEHEVQRAKLVSNLQSSSSSADNGIAVSSMKQKIIDQLRVGQEVEWIVKEVDTLQMIVSPLYSYDDSEIQIKAFVHISNAIDPYTSNDNLMQILKKKMKSKKVVSDQLHPDHPFYGYEAGKKVCCYVLQVRRETSVKGNQSMEVFVVYLALALPVPSDLDTLKQLGFLNSEKSLITKLPFHRMTQSHGKDELKCPSLNAVVITKLEEVSCIVAFSPYLTARLNYIDISSDPEVIETFMKKCFVGLRLIVVVVGIAKENQKIKNIRLSRICIESLINKSDDSLYDITRARNKLSDIQESEYEEGQIVNAMLNLNSSKVPKPPAISVSLPGSKLGRVCITEISDREDWSDLSTFFQKQQQQQEDEDKNQLIVEDLILPGGGGLHHGSIVQARVLEVTSGYIELSLRPSRVNAQKIKVALKPDTIPLEGAVIPAYVVNISNKGCFLRLSTGITGKVLMRDLADEFVKDPETLFPIGKLCQARLLSISQIDSIAKLSLKDSIVVGDHKAKAEILNIQVGNTVTGTVQRVTQEGVFILIENTSLVGLSRKAAALLDMNKTLIEEYEVGDIVRCKVLSVSKTSMKVGLGLRPSFFRSDNRPEEEEEYDDGIYKDDVDMMVEDGEEENNEDDEEYEDNDEDDDEDDEVEEEEDEDGLDNIRMLNEGDDGSDSEIENMIKAAALNYDSNSDEEEEKEDIQVVSSKSTKNKKSRVENIHQADDDDDEDEDAKNIFATSYHRNNSSDILGDLPWDDSIPLWNQISTPAASNQLEKEEFSDDEDDDEDGDEENHKNKSKGLRTRQKESLRRKLEQSVREREIALETGTLLPETKDDFERLLIAQPNSSYLWIQYMAFYLQSAAIEPARAIAARALRTIDYREEDEKYNVWIALLNMEHKYGSMETLEKAFTRATSESKGKHIYLAMANTYEQAQDIKGADVIYNKALKRPQYKKSKKVWIAYHQFKLRTGDVTDAKTQLTRSLQSLSRHKHIEVISKYAMAEYEYGSPDRGRIVFEELLINYPKRTDIWNLYIDKEIKNGFINQARQLFDRMIHSKQKTHTMKVIFKKYVEFEVLHGTEQTQEAVRQKAIDYVNSIA